VERFILWANTSTNESDYKHNVNMCLSYSCDVGMQNGELNYRATMATIRTTEGHGTPLAYDTYYGGGKMKDYTDHPGEIVKKWGHASSAAGAYQIMKNTWFDVGKAKGLKSILGLNDISPESQDKVVVYLINRVKGANDLLQEGDYMGALSKLKGTWTSLRGGIHEWEEGNSNSIFLEQRANELIGNSIISTPQGSLDVPIERKQ
jgi:muramidase (phage lysozyme)